MATKERNTEIASLLSRTQYVQSPLVVNEYDTLARTTDKGPTVHIYRQHAHCEISIRVTHIAVRFHAHWEILMCALYTVGIRLHRSWNFRVIGGKIKNLSRNLVYRAEAEQRRDKRRQRQSNARSERI